MSTEALQKFEHSPLATMADIERLGAAIESSGMFGANQKGQGVVLALTCATEKISPLQFMRTYHIIEGRPTMRADAMLARFVERGGAYKILERSEKRAAATFTANGNTITQELTMADAEKMEITKDKHGNMKKNWRATPRQMLWARLVSDTIRALDPGVCAGIYTPEEVVDFVDVKVEHVPPAPKPIAPAVVAAEMAKAEVSYPAPTAPVPAAPEPAKKAAPAPVAEKVVTGTAEPDYSVCPTPGPNRGKPWSDFPVDSLRLTLKTPGIPHGYAVAIKAAIEAKEGK